MTAKWAPKVPETGGEATLLHLLPSLEVSRVFLLLTASSTEKYLQSAASCQENLLQTLKTRGICSSLDPCECLCVCVCVCVCVCSKLWRANKHVLSPQERSALSFLSYHYCNRISVANNVNKIWRHLSYFIISIFQNARCSAASLNARFYLLIMLEADHVSGGRQTLGTNAISLLLTRIPASEALQCLTCPFLWEEKKVLFGSSWKAFL